MKVEALTKVNTEGKALSPLHEEGRRKKSWAGLTHSSRRGLGSAEAHREGHNQTHELFLFIFFIVFILFYLFYLIFS